MTENTRTPILAANWKMYKTSAEAGEFLRTLLGMIGGVEQRQVVIAPAFTALAAAASELEGQDLVTLAAQNMYFEAEGAFTGEISARMLQEFGVRWVILGHSERRHIFGEGNKLIGRKVKAALAAGLIPILCIGETLSEREQGNTLKVLEGQLEAGFSGVDSGDASGMVVAYEPVWAIGTGVTATPEQAPEAHGHVRDWLKKRYASDVAERIRILYGGSVKPGNVDQLMALPDVDGALVGGASLEPESFARIVQCETGRI